MVKGQAYKDGLFSEHDRLHMKIVYRRPVGNRDIDDDPPQHSKAPHRLPSHEVFIDAVEDFSLPPKLRRKLETLPSISQVLLQELQPAE
jgi:hypothetical protein